MNGLPFRQRTCEPAMLTGGVLGLHTKEIEDAMSAYFTLKKTTFRDSPAWCLEQSSGLDLLPFAVHHRKVRQAVSYAQQVAGLMRCVVVLEGRHRVVRAVKAVTEGLPPSKTSRS